MSRKLVSCATLSCSCCSPARSIDLWTSFHGCVSPRMDVLSRHPWAHRVEQLLRCSSSLSESTRVWKHFTRQPACSKRGFDMRRFNDLVQWHKASGQPVVVHDLTLTPQSQVLIVRFPWGAWVWHRPTAIQVEHNGRVEQLPIVDLTRLIQLGLVGLGVVIITIISFGPDGVTVKPVVDVTEIALAGVTVWGTMLLLLRRMRKASKR